MSIRHAPDQRGQALVEFSLAIIVFLVLMMGVFDFGRAIYQYNGVAQAAREIARVTAVHPGPNFTTAAGRSAETQAVIATQKGLIPNLGDPTIQCVAIDGTVITKPCTPNDWIRVQIAATYTPITPLLGLVGTWTLFSSSTSSQLQLIGAS
jgi:Flp pilus assembly protein TadG